MKMPYTAIVCEMCHGNSFFNNNTINNIMLLRSNAYIRTMYVCVCGLMIDFTKIIQ